MDTPPTFAATVATAVSTAIQEQGQTVLGLAEATGIARVTLTRRLAGHTPFTVAELDAIASALGVDVRTFTADAA